MANTPQPSEYDPWARPSEPGVAQDQVVGKVIMRIPWLGNVVLYMRTQAGLLLVAVLITLLIVIEFVVPVLRKKTQSPTETHVEKGKAP